MTLSSKLKQIGIIRQHQRTNLVILSGVAPQVFYRALYTPLTFSIIALRALHTNQIKRKPHFPGYIFPYSVIKC
jgi:hypothetical protein